MLQQIAYTNIKVFHRGRVNKLSDEDRAFMALSISITTKIDKEMVDAVLAL